jgi:hypothetical protein
VAVAVAFWQVFAVTCYLSNLAVKFKESLFFLDDDKGNQDDVVFALWEADEAIDSVRYDLPALVLVLRFGVVFGVLC